MQNGFEETDNPLRGAPPVSDPRGDEGKRRPEGPRPETAKVARGGPKATTWPYLFDV